MAGPVRTRVRWASMTRLGGCGVIAGPGAQHNRYVRVKSTGTVRNVVSSTTSRTIASPVRYWVAYVNTFWAVGSAASTTTENSVALSRSKTNAPKSHATKGCTTDFNDTASNTGPLSGPRPGAGLPYKEIPKANSIAGTAIPPINSNGSMSGPGGSHPDAESTTPANEPITTGLRTGVPNDRRSTGQKPRTPPPFRSRIVSPTGAMISSCISRIGATRDASSNTYAAMGIPRLPAFT